jgi:hypothetical protein
VRRLRREGRNPHKPGESETREVGPSVTSTVLTGQAPVVLDIRPPSAASINATQYVTSTLHISHDLIYCLHFLDQEQRVTPFRKLFLHMRKSLALAKQV